MANREIVVYDSSMYGETIDVVKEANIVVDQYITKKEAKYIMRAEKYVTHEGGMCGCNRCMHEAKDQANDAVLRVLGVDEHSHPTKDSFQEVSKYLYFLVPQDRGFKMVHGFDLDQEKYDAWWEGIAKKKQEPENPNGLSPFGTLPA